MRNKRKTVRVVHNAPKKKGKQEYREFKTVEEALAYTERNMNDKHRLGKGLMKEAGFRYGDKR